MSKYDLPMEMDENSVLMKMSKRIQPGMTVLELGCASGRMTRYMKEQLGCQVYIVEMDAEAFSKASVFAVDGYCGDIEQGEWQALFVHIRFDCILIADVLEHLKRPDQTLSIAGQLLKDDGEVFVSIPNIGHNDILVKLYQNRFEYTPVGLLDDTHIHFWGLLNLESFYQPLGFEAVLIDGSCVAPFNTEQHPDESKVPSELRALLSYRPYNDIYQFFLVLQKQKWVQSNNIVQQNKLKKFAKHEVVSCYFDMGKGYREETHTWLNTLSDKSEKHAPYRCTEIPEGCVKMRFDPTLGSLCVVANLNVISNRGNCSFVPLNGFTIGKNIIFDNENPQIEISIMEETEWVDILCEIYIVSHEPWNAVFQEIMLQNTIDLHIKEYAQQCENYARQSEVRAQMSEAHAQQSEARAQQSEARAQQSEARAQMSEASAQQYEVLAQQNKMALNAQRDQCFKLEQEFAKLEEECSGLKAKVELAEDDKLAQQRDCLQLKARYLAIQGSRTWRMTAPIRVFLDACKRNRAFCLLYKTVHSLKYFGTRGTWARIKKYLMPPNGKLTIQPLVAHEEPVTAEIHTFTELVSWFSDTAFNARGTVLLPNVLKEYDTLPGQAILLITHELSLTGAPMAIYYFAKALKQNGFLPLVVSPQDSDLSASLVEDQIPIMICPTLYQGDVLLQVSHLFCMVIANTIVSAPVVQLLDGGCIPVLWWIHEAAYSYNEHFLNMMPLALSDNVHVYAGGRHAANILRRNRPDYPIDELLYYVPDYAQCHSDSEFRLEGTHGKKVFCMIGALEERKGHDIFVDAIDLLTQEQRAQSIFVFVGKRYHVPTYQKIFDCCKRYPDQVRYIEQLPRKDLQRLYEQMDCLICASRDDPMPIVVTDALQFSKLVICSEHTGSAALIQEEDGGLIYCDDDPGQLAKQMMLIFSQAEELEEMRKRARKTYERFFSKEKFDQSILRIIGNLLEPSTELQTLSANVSVIMPLYNAGANFKELLSILNCQKALESLEIIAVDSGSKDETVNLCHQAGVRVIEISQQEFSHSYARNLGARFGTGDIFLFMTQDAMPTDDYWVSRMIRPILANGAAAVSCRERCPIGTELYYCAASFNHIRHQGILEHNVSNILLASDQENVLRSKAALNDVSSAIRADVFQKYLYRFNYAEDLDMGLRLLHGGYRLELLADTEVVHGHNRKAGYYVKRAFVESLVMGKLHVAWESPRVSAEIAACKVCVGYAALDQVLNQFLSAGEACSDATSLLKEVKRVLEAQMKSPPDVDRILQGKAKVHWDPLLEQCVVLARPWCGECTNGATDIIYHLIYYIDYVLLPYLSNRPIDPLDSSQWNEVYDCLMKQFAVAVGGELARLESGTKFSADVQFLAQGV